MKKNFLYVLLAISVLMLFFTSCVSSGLAQKQGRSCSTVIDGRGIKNKKSLTAFFMSNNPGADVKKVDRLAKYYIEECRKEGINSDVAFVQMCLETGFLKFGNLVTEEMNNFCGLGAIDEDNRGLWFGTEQLGVRAHVQHLHAYGTTRSLKGDLVDFRYKYVKPRGKAPTVAELSGTWAADKSYGTKLAGLLEDLSRF